MAPDNKKTVLINPPAARITERHYEVSTSPRIALAYLAASLKMGGVEYETIDAKFEGLSLKDIINRLKKIDFSMVGITSMTTEILDAARMAREIKAIKPQCTTVIGGAHANALPEDTLREFTCFDIACSGEGESTMLELAQGKDWRNINGISYRHNGQYIKNPERGFIEELDSLPFPEWEAFPPAKQYPILSSRGCCFKCNFCMRVLGERIRSRNPDLVFEEINYVYQRFRPEIIEFYDETFGFYREKTERLLGRLIESGLNKRMGWRVQTRVDIINPALFSLMKEAGCVWIGFGIESGNQNILNGTKKRINLVQAKKAVDLARNAGLKVGTFFILGHPHENRDTVLDTINFALKLNSSTVSLGIMTPYPGTEIYGMAKKNQGGYKLVAQNWDDYNKQEGGALELENLLPNELHKYQLIGYIRFYLLSFRLDRLKEIFKFVSPISLFKVGIHRLLSIVKKR